VPHLTLINRSTNVPSFSTTLEQAIHGALALANARRHELATLEHLLLALIDEGVLGQSGRTQENTCRIHR
jgi:ATP-dependent Clp protease ATP-binding subunit ClpA